MVELTRIGVTDLYVRKIGLGTNAVGGHNIYPSINDEIGIEMVRSAIECGINFFDTAYHYGRGISEELIGSVLKEYGCRNKIVIATKAAHRYVNNKVFYDNSPSFLVKAVEDSLRRLQTDYIDLFYIHFPDENTPKDEAVGMLFELKNAGKLRAIGVSNFTLEQLKEANKDGYVDVFQSDYNLLLRGLEKEILPYLIEHNISFIPSRPLASGLLTGKYNLNTKVNESLKKRKVFQRESYVRNLEKIEQLREIALIKGVEVANVVLAWYLTLIPIDVVIPGAKHSNQVMNNLKTLDIKLTKDEIKKIDFIFQE